MTRGLLSSKIEESLWQPAVLLPSQAVHPAARQRCGEVRLVAAVFEDALQCVIKNARARRGPRRRNFVEARDWFRNDSREWPFAFANVCDLLALDANAVREHIERLVDYQRRQPAPLPAAQLWRSRTDPLTPTKSPIRK